MATLYGDNATSYNASPVESLPVGDYNGKVRFWHDQITLSAELAVNDVIVMGAPLPPNARVINAGLLIPACGATGIVDFGISGGDVDYFIAGADPGAAAVNAKMASEAGFLVKSEDALQPAIKCSEVTASASGDTWHAWIQYVLE
jgi:hypothetical protein